MSGIEKQGWPYKPRRPVIRWTPMPKIKLQGSEEVDWQVWVEPQVLEKLMVCTNESDQI